MEKILHKYILNPCDYDYDIHFNRNHAIWISNTQVAKWNIEKLRLNSKKQIDVREARALFFEIIRRLSEKKNYLELELKNYRLTESYKIEIINQINKLNQHINLYKFKCAEPLD